MPAKKSRSRKKSGATRKSEEKSSGLSWMVMGLLVGLFVVFLVYLDKIPNKDSGQTTSSNQEKSKPSSKQNGAKKSSPPKHQFDFYTVLPDRKVEIVDENDNRAAKKTISSKESKASNSQQIKNQLSEEQRKNKEKTASAQPPSLYQLQVGAFKELSKADAMKARLAFLGVESNIQVMQSNGQKLYRVRVGPSTDSQKIERIKEQLKAQNINTFVQKLNG